MYTKPLLILSLLASIMLLATSCGGGGSGDTLTLSISASDDTVNEGQSASFVVSLDRANDTGSTITGTVTLDGVDSNDISTDSVQYQIAENETSTTVSVDITDDELFENTETLTADLGDPNVSGVSLGTNTAKVTIIDNDNAPGSVTANLSVDRHGNEVGPVAISYLLTLGKANGTTGAITFSAALSGSATASTDYVAPSPMEVSVPAGASTATFSVTVNNDSDIDENETLALTLTNPSDQAISTGTLTATADILDSLKTGQFKLGVNVEGLSYESGAQNGLTDAMGRFTYEVGQSVTFSLNSMPGGIPLGRATMPKRIMTPMDLVENGSILSGAPARQEVTNIIRFLLLLDKDGDDENGVEIWEDARNAASTHNWASNPARFDTSNAINEFEDVEVDFNNRLNAAKPDLPAAVPPGVNHSVYDEADAWHTLVFNTLYCINTGIYLGTFSGGTDHGRIGIINYQSYVNAMAYSNAFTRAYHIAANMPFTSYDQDAKFVNLRSVVIPDVLDMSLNGNLTSVDTVNGKWANLGRIDVDGGRYTAERVGGDWAAPYRIAGMITEDPLNPNNPQRGFFDVQIEDDPAVGPTARKIIGGSLYWLGQGDVWMETAVDTTNSSYAHGTRDLSIKFDDGTEITDTISVGGIDKGFALTRGTWANTTTGHSGVVAESYGCRLN